MAASDLGWEAWVVVAAAIVALLTMAGDWVGPDLVFTTLIGFLMAARILPVAVAGTNYGNTGLLTVIMLYIVAEGIYQTGGLEWVFTKVLGRNRSVFWALIRMMIPCIILSAFLNNTPVVALLIPIIISWSRRTGVPAKKLLIPLSYAAVLGGTITLIGTSTNLVIVGAQENRYKNSTSPPPTLNIFSIAPYGVPYAIWGLMFVLTVERWLLPGNNSKFASNLQIALRVISTSPTIGKSLLDAGLYKVHATTLTVLKRGKELIHHPSAQLVVEEGDILYYAGELDPIISHAEEFGLLLVTDETELSDEWRDAGSKLNIEAKRIIQVKVKTGGPLVGVRVSDANLRSHFDLALVAIQRGAYGREDGPLNDIVLGAEDVLLLEQGLVSDIEAPEFLAAFHKYHLVRESQVTLFTGSFLVTSNDIAGKTIGDAGLRGIPGIHVLGLDPAGNPELRSSPADLKHVLRQGDVLWVAADQQGYAFLAKFPGVTQSQQPQINSTGVSVLYQQLHQAVLAPNSSLIGLSVSDARFRNKFHGAVVAVQRVGLPPLVDTSKLVLQSGDVLLVSGHVDWAKTHKANRNFVLLSTLAESSPPKRNRAIWASLLGLAMVLTQIIPGVMEEEWINLWPGAILTGAVMLITGCLSGDQARRSIMWDVYLAIAGAFGLSNAMERTGVANEFAQLFISIGNAIGTKGAALTSVYVATALLSELLTNNAAGAIMYPIAAIAADQLGIPPDDMAMAIMLGASAGFINPFSYQCNLMVYAAGNYKTREFAKIGAPFQLYLLVVAGFILSFIDDWHTVWIISFSVLAVYIAIPAVWSFLPLHVTEPVDTFIEKIISGIENGLAAVFCFWRKDRRASSAQRANSSPHDNLGVVSRSSSIDEGVKK